MWIATQDDHAARVGLVSYGEASECRCEHFEDAHGMSNAASRANQGTPRPLLPHAPRKGEGATQRIFRGHGNCFLSSAAALMGVAKGTAKFSAPQTTQMPPFGGLNCQIFFQPPPLLFGSISHRR